MNKWFPILKPGTDARAVPWDLVEKHRVQIEKNHYQTLERLAERGGLSWAELVAAMAGKSYQAMFRNL